MMSSLAELIRVSRGCFMPEASDEAAKGKQLQFWSSQKFANMNS